MGKIRCDVCNTILESKTRHDFKQCKCENSAHVDGGEDYMKVGAVDLNQISIWNEEKNEFIKNVYNENRLCKKCYQDLIYNSQFNVYLCTKCGTFEK